MELLIYGAIFIGITIYIALLLRSLSYSCGGWDKTCGLCWVGVVQSPLILIEWIYDKIKRKQEV